MEQELCANKMKMQIYVQKKKKIENKIIQYSIEKKKTQIQVASAFKIGVRVFHDELITHFGIYQFMSMCYIFDIFFFF